MRLQRWMHVGISVVALTFGSATTHWLGAQAQPQAGGTITGTVTAREGGQPIGDAQVLVVGTHSAVATAENGKFTLRNVRPGPADVQVLRVGYQSLKKSITVSATEPTTVDFQITVAVVQLAEVVTTATGQ